jgi:hypothetical protein
MVQKVWLVRVSTEHASTHGSRRPTLLPEASSHLRYATTKSRHTQLERYGYCSRQAEESPRQLREEQLQSIPVI